MIKIKLPGIRFQLMDHLLDAATSLEREHEWIERNQLGHLSSIQMNTFLHFFLDDTDLLDDAEGCVGWYLYSLEEAALIQPIAAACDAMLEKHGRDLPDAEYYHLPEWQGIVRLCRRALEVLRHRPGPVPVPGLADWQGAAS